MSICCGINFCARQQTVCYRDTADGAAHLAELEHQEDDLRSFFPRFTGGAIVGIEAGGYSAWFVELVEGLSHKVLIGDAAGLILNLLLRGEFPQVLERREVLWLLRYRHKPV